MLLRCKLDGLFLTARRNVTNTKLVAYDGDESFEMERLEAVYYELVAAAPDDLCWVDRVGYRLLRRAPGFTTLTGDLSM